MNKKNMDLKQEELNRYSRHIQLEKVGISGQKVLKQAKVLVIGAGGLGCPVLQYLTAAGIGTIGIVDHDVVEESNLQRQVLFNSLFIGKNKAIAAKEQLERLNPFIKLIAYPEKLNQNNAVALFNQYDIMVDATDDFDSRYLINDAALICNKPFVFGAVHQFEGQVSVFNFKGGPTYRCLFPKSLKSAGIPNCEEAGVLGVLPGILGTYQANEVLKVILGIGEVLTGKLLLINTLNHSNSILGITRNEKEIEQVLTQGIQSPNEIQDLRPSQLKERMNQGESFDFLDVREVDEQPQIETLKGRNIPLGKLEVKEIKTNNNKNLVVYCQTGIRSKKAIPILQQKGYNKLYNLKGGIIAWMQEKESILKEIS